MTHRTYTGILLLVLAAQIAVSWLMRPDLRWAIGSAAVSVTVILLGLAVRIRAIRRELAAEKEEISRRYGGQ